jgi:hypothetical protein
MRLPSQIASQEKTAMVYASMPAALTVRPDKSPDFSTRAEF